MLHSPLPALLPNFKLQIPLLPTYSNAPQPSSGSSPKLHPLDFQTFPTTTALLLEVPVSQACCLNATQPAFSKLYIKDDTTLNNSIELLNPAPPHIPSLPRSQEITKTAIECSIPTTFVESLLPFHNEGFVALPVNTLT